jgi:hypothetical protein
MVEILMVEVVRRLRGWERRWRVVETELDTPAERTLATAAVMAVGFVVVMAVLE